MSAKESITDKDPANVSVQPVIHSSENGEISDDEVEVFKKTIGSNETAYRTVGWSEESLQLSLTFSCSLLSSFFDRFK
jgi:hypothetical protein